MWLVVVLQSIFLEAAGAVGAGENTAISDPDDRYINEDGKGPSNHTNEFMDGYNSGYNSCSGSDRGHSDPMAIARYLMC